MIRVGFKRVNCGFMSFVLRKFLLFLMIIGKLLVFNMEYLNGEKGISVEYFWVGCNWSVCYLMGICLIDEFWIFLFLIKSEILNLYMFIVLGYFMCDIFVDVFLIYFLWIWYLWSLKDYVDRVGYCVKLSGDWIVVLVVFFICFLLLLEKIGFEERYLLLSFVVFYI